MAQQSRPLPMSESSDKKTATQTNEEQEALLRKKNYRFLLQHDLSEALDSLRLARLSAEELCMNDLRDDIQISEDSVRADLERVKAIIARNK